VNAACRDCRLAPDPAAPASLPAQQDGEPEIEYGLDSWPAEDRVGLGMALNQQSVPWRWEPGPVLVIRELDEAIVEAALGQAGEEEAGWEDVEGEEADETAQAAMSDLFLAADRLVHSPSDGDLVEEVSRLASVVDESAPPFGVEPSVWDEISRLAGAVVVAAEEGDEEGVEEAARAVRDFLRDYV
jgi:hypothetical protein